MLPERAKIGVSLMISLTVNAFKRVRAQFPLFHFKSRQVDFEICLATSCEIIVVFVLIRTFTLDTLQSLSLARKVSELRTMDLDFILFHFSFIFFYLIFFYLIEKKNEEDKSVTL